MNTIIAMKQSMGMDEYLRSLWEEMLGPIPLRRQLEIKLESAEQAKRAGYPGGELITANAKQLLILLDAIERKLSHNDQSVTTSEGER